jgi:RNA polymerase sigma-70 factor (ECF subfamily)
LEVYAGRHPNLSEKTSPRGERPAARRDTDRSGTGCYYGRIPETEVGKRTGVAMAGDSQSTSVSLLERLRQPDQPDAWPRFVELYTPLLFYWARRAGLQPADAADLVQDVFAVLVRKLPEFRHDQRKSFRSWLRTVTLNKWHDRGRRRGRIPSENGDVDLDEQTGPGGLEEFWEDEHRQFLLRRAMELMRTEFQPNTWQACWEHGFRQRPAAEVAAELGISENAVYIAKVRVVRRLRQELQGLLD